jgi:hypothetical protein
MKKVLLMLVSLLAAMATAPAQITVQLVLQQEQFLRGESLPVAVRITNRSGQALHLGAQDDWLTFSIESREAGVVARSGEVPVAGEFDLGTSKVATKRVDLAPYFALNTPGRYNMVAYLRVKEWGMEVPSPPRSFDVIEGAKLWEQEFGIPAQPGATNDVPELRKYSLQQANYIRGQLRLYLRVVDGFGRVIRVVPVGAMLSFSRPEAQIDSLSHLNLLYQDRPQSFSYLVFDPDGQTLVRQTYDYLTTRPRLKLAGDGKIVVAGGERRVLSSDIPPPPKEISTAETNSAPETVKTNAGAGGLSAK